MSKRLFNHSVNVVAYRKNNKNFAATIAWAMQVDYDKIILLMGSQSDTGNNIEKGQIIGVSSLAKNQKEIAQILGDNHSKKVEKLAEINYKIEKNAITIENAVNKMIVEVIDVMHLDEIEEDNLIYGKVIKNDSTNDEFLNMSDFQ